MKRLDVIARVELEMLIVGSERGEPPGVGEGFENRDVSGCERDVGEGDVDEVLKVARK